MKRTGTVVSFTGGHAVVRLDAGSGSSCGSCSLAMLCSRPSDVTVALDGSSDPVGRRVELTPSLVARRQAACLLLAVPLLLAVAVLALCRWAGLPDLFGALAALATIALWFLALYVRRSLGFSAPAFDVRFIG